MDYRQIHDARGTHNFEAERDRRAKVIAAEGEFQASTKLSEASEILSQNPMALQLRYLQSMIEMSSDKSSTIVLPLPIDLLKPFLDKNNKDDNS